MYWSCEQSSDLGLLAIYIRIELTVVARRSILIATAVHPESLELVITRLLVGLLS